MGEHYKKKEKKKLSLLKFSYQSICVTHYVLEAHILGSARCFCAIARSSFSLHATANAKVSRIVLDKTAKHSLPPVLCVARMLPNQ